MMRIVENKLTMAGGVKLSRIGIKYLMIILLVNIGVTTSFAVSRYASIDRPRYLYLEYQLIMQNEMPVFVMNQPYTEFEISQNKTNDFAKKLLSNQAARINSGEGISILINPGWQFGHNNTQTNSYPTTLLDGYFKIDNLIGVNRIYASKMLASDPGFHGDKSKWTSVNMFDAYMRYASSSHISFFAGRTARNYGIPNEYSLFLSNNPYPYDHFGLSASGDRIQFSWYFGRLNDMQGTDAKGLTIPIGETEVTHRYLAFQRLDWKVGKQFQFGLSEATLYGSPNQSPVAAYMNPLNFYYLSQRNQQIQMNGSWQINVFYYVPRKLAFYIDFYIDDLIINNEDGVVARDIHPDRLAVMSKLSFPDLYLPQTLSSLRYVRVWNETYVTWRNYENWVYYNKGLGFPERSYEGLKLESSYFGGEKWQTTLSCEVWRKGNKPLFSLVEDGEDSTFPSSPVTRGLTSTGKLHFLYKHLMLDMHISYEILATGEDVNDTNIGFRLGLNYRLKMSSPLQ
jgi:hypothetical protein